MDSLSMVSRRSSSQHYDGYIVACRLPRHHLWSKPEGFSFLDGAFIIDMSLFKKRVTVSNFGT